MENVLSQSFGKNDDTSVDNCCAADLEVIFAKSLEELPQRLLMVISEWKKRLFYDVQDAMHGDFKVIFHDAKSFVEKREGTGF